MIETALIIGLFGITLPILYYNTRKISKIDMKVDLLYENLNIKFKFKDNNKK